MKKVILALAFALALAVPVPAPAHVGGNTVVIIDSGVNTQGFLKNSIVDEACFIEYGKCPNGQNSMTGAGASHISPTSTTDRVFSHGSQMASVVLQKNPTARIVPIRIIGMSSKGFATTYTTKAVTQALTWVNQNAERLGVGAVLVASGKSYNGACPIEQPLRDLVVALSGKGIPVISSTGNSARKQVDYPSCAPEVVTVGATDTPYRLAGYGIIKPVAYYTNFGAEIDFFALGRYTTTRLDGTQNVTDGTSNSAAAVAGIWTSRTSPTVDTLRSSAGIVMNKLTPIPNIFLE